MLLFQLNLASGPAVGAPIQFYFETRFNAARSTVYTSNAVTIEGMTGSSSSVVVGGEQSLNGGAFTSSNVTVTNGDTLTLRGTSSANAATTTLVTATVLGVTGTFAIVTAVAESARTRWHRRVFARFRKRS
jgi:hypothetical protein